MVERSRSRILRYVSLRITDNITLKGLWYMSQWTIWIPIYIWFWIYEFGKWSHWVAICYYTRICVLLVVILSWIYYNWFMVILRSTTGPCGRPMLEVAYGDILFSLHRDCLGGKLGKSGWGVDMMSPMLDIPGSTPVWAHWILFFGFSYYINYIYIYILFSNFYTI